MLASCAGLVWDYWLLIVALRPSSQEHLQPQKSDLGEEWMVEASIMHRDVEYTTEDSNWTCSQDCQQPTTKTRRNRPWPIPTESNHTIQGHGNPTKLQYSTVASTAVLISYRRSRARLEERLHLSTKLGLIDPVDCFGSNHHIPQRQQHQQPWKT